MADQWMTEDQRYCYEVLCDWLCGAHHVPTVKPFGMGIKVSIFSSRLSTFDFDQLTRLVFFAHDRCVRVELTNGGPGRTGVVLHRRHAREGCITQRHPTIEEALAIHRRYWPSGTLPSAHVEQNTIPHQLPEWQLVEQWMEQVWHEGTPVRVSASDVHIAQEAAKWAFAIAREYYSLANSK